MADQPRPPRKSHRIQEFGTVVHTQDLLVSQVIRTGERQVWTLAEHLVAVPLVRT